MEVRDILKDVAIRLGREEESDDVKRLRDKLLQIQRMIEDGKSEPSAIVREIGSFLDDSLSTALLHLHERKALELTVQQLKKDMKEMKTQMEERETARETAWDEKFRKMSESISDLTTQSADLRTDWHDLLSEHRPNSVLMAEFNRHFHILLAKRVGEKSSTLLITMEQEEEMTKPWEDGPMHRRVLAQLKSFEETVVKREHSKAADSDDSEYEGPIVDWKASVHFQNIRHSLCHDKNVRDLEGPALRIAAGKSLATLQSPDGAQRFRAVVNFHPMLKGVLRILKHCA